MPGDIRRVVISDEGNGRSNGGRRSNGRGNINSERNQTLLIDFFRRNRRRARANELDRERREAEDRRRGGVARNDDDDGGVARNDDDYGDGKKYSHST